MLRGRVGAVLALALLAVPAYAAEPNYPNRSIALIVPFAAGGPTDVVARILGDHMSRTLGQQLVVEHIGCSCCTTGMGRVASAVPDSETLGVHNTGTQLPAPALYPNLKYDPATSFAQVGIANFTPRAIVSKKDNPAKDLGEFIAYLKANQAKLSYGHAGVGSISHVSGILFNAQFGLKPALVAYRGTAPALNDLLGGQIDYMVDQSLNVIPQIKAGTIRVFAIAAAHRLESLPDVPTTKEAGVDFIFSAWNALVAPKGTPKAIIDKLSAALNKALDDPATVKRYVELGSTAPEAAERGPEGLQKRVESEMARITPVLKEAAAK